MRSMHKKSEGLPYRKAPRQFALGANYLTVFTIFSKAWG